MALAITKDGWAALRLGEGPLRSFLVRALYPLSFVVFVGGAIPLFDHFDGMTIGFGIVGVTIPIFFVLERVIPWSERWLGSQGDVHADVGLSLLAIPSAAIMEPGVQLVAIGIAGALATGSAATWPSVWPSEWPILAQGVLALVLGDFFRYWVHRGLHRIPLLWRIHATHHSAERLYFYNGARIHPLEVMLSALAGSPPLLLLGVTPEALAMQFVIGRVIGRFQHCNLDVRAGWLDYVLSSPKNHRWHHSRDLEEASHNYGGDIILWDHVFGTFYLPKDREPSDEIGIGPMPDFPGGLGALLLSPFRFKRLSVEAAALEADR